MQVSIRYFASVREAVGLAQEAHDLPETVQTVGQVRDWLRALDGRHAAALATDKPLRMACNHTLCDAHTALQPGCEVAFFPPVTGG
ncbi:molybdopterin converting factor subunit 1 [Thiomonas sp.]|jgi:molybdopterin synthase sulfur carrier subunit|uniref:molybdopterin converting factor subunit 1 n=1 Tax=Thiomonas sp. TaxID=2047785 RepID=UPI0026106D16|nr:molybdopterin converting factor subunit 1 [Thiomonas sp.]